MRVECEKCNTEVPADDVNVAADTAYCRACGKLMRLSALFGSDSGEFVQDYELSTIDTADTPPGCSSRGDGFGHVVKVLRGAGLGTIVGNLVMCLFWNGIVSVFVVFALASTLQHAGVVGPDWFLAPEKNGGPVSLGMTIFLWLFLTPFIVIGTGMAVVFLTSLLGKIVVTIDGDAGTVFQGIGPLGWRRRFAVGDVTGVVIGRSVWQKNGDSKPVVTIGTRGGGRLRFGSLLTAPRRAWLAAELQRVIEQARNTKPSRRY
ncbi:MAG: hypothetical protein AAF911_08590 [Planctomycetota bacterium]